MNDLKTFYRLDQVSDIPSEDLLRYAIDGHLTLSVMLTSGLNYEPCKPCKEIDPEWHLNEWTMAGKDLLRCHTNLAKIIGPADSNPLDIVIDSGNVRSVLESLFIALPDNQLSKAQFGFNEAVFKNGDEFIRPIGSEDYLFRIPEDGYLVITKANLDAFKAKLGATIAKPKKDKKDLSLRNEAIRNDSKNGATYPVLMKKYSLSSTQISTIVNKNKKVISGNLSVMENVTRHFIK